MYEKMKEKVQELRDYMDILENKIDNSVGDVSALREEYDKVEQDYNSWLGKIARLPQVELDKMQKEAAKRAAIRRAQNALVVLSADNDNHI